MRPRARPRPDEHRGESPVLLRGSGIGDPLPNLRRRLVSGTVYTLASVLVVQVVSLIVSIAYARILGPENLGVLAILTQLSSAIIPLSSLGLGIAIARMVPEYKGKGPRELERLLSSALVITLLAGILVSTGYFAASYNLAVLYGVPELVLLVQVSASIVVLDALLTLAVAVVQGFHRIKELAVIGLVAKAATVPVIVVMTLTWGLIGAVLAGVVSQAFNAAIYAWNLRSIVRTERISISFSRFDRSTAKDILRTALPLFAAFIVMRPALLLQATYLALIIGYSELGLFRVASSLYRIALLLPSSLSIPLLPAISEMYTEGAQDRTAGQLSSLLRITAFLSLPITLAIGLGSVHIIQILYGTEYVAAAPLVFVVSAAAFVDTMGIVVENTLLGTGRTKQVFYLTIMQALVIAGTSYAFITVFGLLGIGFAMLANAVVYATVVGIYLLRRREIRFAEFRTILALALVSFLLAAVIALSVGLSNLGITVAFVAGLCLVEFRLLSKRDRSVLKDSLKSILYREERP